MHRVVTNYTPIGDKGSNINVYVRARPTEDSSDPSEILQIDTEEIRKLNIKDPDPSNRKYGEVSFQFDKIFWTDATQHDIFDNVCKNQVDHVLNGYNSCCFAYGQTGSGKTYTMFGGEGEVRGIIPRSVEYLFQSLSKKTSTTEIAMVCSFLEIYNDQIRDLGKAYLVAMGVEASNSSALYEKTSDIFENLAGKRGNPYFAPAFHRPGSAVASSVENRPGLKEVQDEYNTMNYEIREDNEGNVFVKDLSLIPVTTMEEVASLISMGLRVRATHETKMNSVSSRSHTVFTITVLQRDKITGDAITGMLNLVDLAGSERLKKSESQGIRLKEALHINSSLTVLGKVIMALDPSSENTHIPYRDSKLTRVLQNSLGGNSFTSVIAAVHPSVKFYEECLSTLQFANRCRNVRNNPRVNYVDDSEDKDRKIKRLMEEIITLRNKLSSQNQVVGNPKASSEGVFSAARIISLLKSIGITAALSGDNGIVVNGKKFSLDELLTGDSNFHENSGNEGSRRESQSGSAGNSQEKLQKALKELKESNDTYSMRLKEKKQQYEEQTREMQKLSAELVKCRAVIKHKEFEYSSLLEEKERALTEQKLLLENKQKEELSRILKSNEEISKQHLDERERVPQNLSQYTQLLQKFNKQVSTIEKPLRADFSAHLSHLERNRAQEIDNLKRQYEYWLNEKDRALSGFVEAFNMYRTKKSEQLRMAEKEIVKLYEYTEQIEQILDNVEKGVYQVKQKQGSRGGRSTTGLTFTNAGFDASEGVGAVVLPKGIRPTNPLKSSVMGFGLELTKKIVDKHKERVARLDKMKEEAFQKSLHLAAQTGATATGQIDEVLKKQVQDLLVSRSPKSSRAASNARRSSSPNRSADPKAASPVEFPDGRTYLQTPDEFQVDPTESRTQFRTEQISTQKVLTELASNETIIYIQTLEAEMDKLRKQLKDSNSQLQASKIANASLSRSIEKLKKTE